MSNTTETATTDIEALRAENDLLRRLAEKALYYADQHWSMSYLGGQDLPQPGWMKDDSEGGRALWRAVSALEEEIKKGM